MPYADPKKNREWHRQRREELRQLIDNAKSQPCVDCRQRFPLPAMQFDHVRGTKRFNLASALALAPSKDTLIKEMNKCDVVCANCHAIRTDERRTGQWQRGGRPAGRGDRLENG